MTVFKSKETTLSHHHDHLVLPFLAICPHGWAASSGSSSPPQPSWPQFPQLFMAAP